MLKYLKALAFVALCSILLATGASAETGFGAGQRTGRIALSEIKEASGLAASRKNANVLWVHNDSGDTARIFAIDKTGKLLGTYKLCGGTAIDWEDIAIGPGPENGKDYIYIGDIGDYKGVRKSVQVYRVEEPELSDGQNVSLTDFNTYTLTYEDGPRDAETLMIDPVTKDLYVISKWDSKSKVYRSSASELAAGGTVKMRCVAQLSWSCATAGDISPDGSQIIVRGYWKAALWLRPLGSELYDAFKGTAYTIPLKFEMQGEAICFDAKGMGYYTTTEGANPSIYYFPRLPEKSH